MIIYKATNKINGKCYIGQTIRNIKKRINDHYTKKVNFAFHNALENNIILIFLKMDII